MCDEQGECNSKLLPLFNSSTPEAEVAGDVANEQPYELEATVTLVKAKITFYTFNIQRNRIYISIPKCREGSKVRPKLSRANSRFCSSMSDIWGLAGSFLLSAFLTAVHFCLLGWLHTVCCSPWQTAHSSGVSDIFASLRKSRLHHHNCSGLLNYRLSRKSILKKNFEC